ncbi:MAG: hypothetical protein Q9176_002907 [Flavoplaca citrina]
MSSLEGISGDMVWSSDAERAKYTIGWIAPMAIELTPALALLDRITTLHVANDSNIYKAGRIGDHHVVMVTLDRIGLSAIPSVAAGMYASFRNLKHMLLVGLGGGIPDYALGEQMVLGDVVVSRKVEHLDCGRRTPNGFEFSHQTYEPSRALLKAVNTLWSTHLSQGTQIPRILQGIRQKLHPTIRENREDLGPDADQLFDSDYHHKDNAKSCKNCCDPKRSRSRQERGPKAHREKDSPLIHYGTIGSANSLMVGSEEREKFYNEFGTICFEMEAAVLMEYRCLVVRGISDYSDSHKNKEWQPYAAATAAAYAHELIMTLPAPVNGVNYDRYQTPSMDNEESSTSQARDPTDTTGLHRLNLETGHVHWTVYRSRNSLFTGRDDILRNLEATVRDVVKGSPSPDQCTIVISGMGGQGKSEICLQLAYRVRQSFWGVFWVDVSTTSSAKNDFVDIAKKLGIETKSMEEARQGLANAKESWMLVLDNADDPDVDYQSYFPAGLLGVTMLTTRNRDCHRYASTPELAVELEGLPESDARGLLLQATNMAREQWGTFQDDAQEVATLLQSHPLALIQAGAYISRAHCTIAEYPRVFERQRKRLLAFRPTQAQSRYRDVYTTFEASANVLHVSPEEAAKDALQLLSMLGVCAPSRLPLQRLFEEGWNGAQVLISNNNSDDDNSLGLTQWHVSCLPPLLQAGAGAWDPFRLVEAVQLLESFSLVSADTHNDFLSVSMHPLTNAWALDRLATAAQHNAWLATGCLVAVSNHNYMLWEKLGRQLQPHLVALTSLDMKHIMFASEPPTKVSSIIERCGWLLRDMRDDAKLKDLMDNLMLYLNLDSLTVDVGWLPVYKLLAQSRKDNAKAQKAASLLEQVVQIQEQTLAKDHPELLYSQYSLASAYRAYGQVEKAVSLLEQVVRIQEQKLAKANPSLLASQRALATAYHWNGQVEKAVSLLERVVHIQGQTLAKDHPDLLVSQHNLANAYKGNGQVEKAVSLLERVVHIQGQILAKEHPDQLWSEHVLATIFWDLGRREDALRLMKHVVEIRREVFDKHHPDLINSEGWLKDFEDEMIETEAA